MKDYDNNKMIVSELRKIHNNINFMPCNLEVARVTRNETINTLKKIIKTFSLVDADFLITEITHYFNIVKLKNKGLGCDYNLVENREHINFVLDKYIDLHLNKIESNLESLKPIKFSCWAKSIANFSKECRELNKEFEKTLNEVKKLDFHKGGNSYNSKYENITVNDNVLNLTVPEYIKNMKHSYPQTSQKELKKIIKSAKKLGDTSISLQQRLKGIKEKHNKIDNDHKKMVDTFKACYEAGSILCQVLGAKTKYDFIGIIRIPKIY